VYVFVRRDDELRPRLRCLCVWCQCPHLPLLAVLRELYTLRLEGVKRVARGGDGYSAVQYAAAALRLLTSPCGGVVSEDMCQLLAEYAYSPVVEPQEQYRLSAEVLLRLVQANALALRPFSPFARDIPPDAFGKGTSMVTAPSAMHLYCMGLLRPELQSQLEFWKQRRQVGVLLVLHQSIRGQVGGQVLGCVEPSLDVTKLSLAARLVCSFPAICLHSLSCHAPDHKKQQCSWHLADRSLQERALSTSSATVDEVLQVRSMGLMSPIVVAGSE